MFDEDDKTIIGDAGQNGALSSEGSDRTLRDSVPATRRLKVGDVILGQYEVLGELGQGGMGVVYRCLDRVGRIEVAVKALPPELAHDADEMDAVQYNFSLVANLVHQNIAACRTLALDRAAVECYLVMECVQGVTLKSFLRRHGGSLPLEEALPMLRQVAEALDFAHGKKVMHRDIKPGNIMLCPDGQVKVLDFGLAAQIRSSMSRMSRMSQAYTGNSGTRQYKAPEQWRGRPQCAATDQYALAVTAYEMLSGHVPFDVDDIGIMSNAVLNEQPMPIEGLPDAVNKALARGLAKEPSKRFASCRDFARALEEGARREETAGLRGDVCGGRLQAEKGAAPFSKPREKDDNQALGSFGRRSEMVVELPGGVAMKLIKIEKGSFMMGSPADENDRSSDEQQHLVHITRDFWLGETEVTQEQYQAVMGENPSYFSHSFLFIKKGGKYPVENVSWHDAMDFCKRLTERERIAGRLPAGYEYTLPTEAQWEFAARGGSKSKGFKYSGSDNLDEVGWHSDNSGGETHPVKGKSPNELGLYDMSGNVWEWCRDSCDWQGDAVTNTYRDGISDPFSASGSQRVFRGGSWFNRARLCRTAIRGSAGPTDRYYALGFRVALAPSK